MLVESMNHQTRVYQQEMFERSMEGNRIIVMDTGSGKTRVAILRIEAELDRCPSDKRVWFLTPSVELCIQQHRVLSAALPAYKHRLLIGSDNVDRWGDRSIWDTALDQKRVVVSTYAVLAEALGHGFLHIASLSLIVFDEAHYCIKKHPANVIMRDFYHPTKAIHGSSSVPHILGLSASLIMSSNLMSLQTIERNLDSISVTPRIHREDLLRHVHRPVCRLLHFHAFDTQDGVVRCQSLMRLMTLRDHLASSGPINQPGQLSSLVALDNPLPERRDASQAVHKFCLKAKGIYEGLGVWAVDYFIAQTIQALEKGKCDMQNLFDTRESSRQALLSLFSDYRLRALCEDHLDPNKDNVSSKVKCLISFLLEETDDDPVCIVFVEQRVTTSVLSTLLHRHLETKERLRCLPFVGSSNVSSRKHGITELIDLSTQKEAVERFRVGACNLIVSTNALEEGIDVQSCNVIACFDPPANLKSFIQRRGRARQVLSRLGILVSTAEQHIVMNRWQKLEEELSRICQSDRQQTLVAKAAEELSEEMDYTILVPSTRAKLTADTTLQHLHHFCNRLPHRPFVDCRPIFSFQEDDYKMISATVSLPSCLSAPVRRATSLRKWQTERAARKDAAFQAYYALYKAGLLNENLLPLSSKFSSHDGVDEEEDRADKLDIPPQTTIWAKTKADKMTTDWFETGITVTPPEALSKEGEICLGILLVIPERPLPLPALLLHWSQEAAFTIKFGRSTRVPQPDGLDLQYAQDTTRLFYASPRSKRHTCCSTDFVTLFLPYLQHGDPTRWLEQYSQEQNASSAIGTSPASLVRVPHPGNPPYIFQRWSSSGGKPTVECVPLPRRRNFIQSASTGATELSPMPSCAGNERGLELFPADKCVFDGLPLPLSRIGLFMPAILQHIEDHIIADRLQSSLLRQIPFDTLGHIITAICAPSAKRATNYQRFEFIGDTVLKFVVSCHLFSCQPYWHEGILTVERSKLVSNATLAAAAVHRGLAPHIITESISYKEWTVPVFSSHLHCSNNRQMSRKTLADVVEALIGAAWVDSGISAARECVNIWLPEIPIAIDLSAIKRPKDFGFSVKHIEYLIGYTFNDSTLLCEAVTHASCGIFAQNDSYERLEYLGDAVLDMLVVQYTVGRADHLSQGRMTRLKAALVNARLLGFLCLDLHRLETFSNVGTNAAGEPTTTTSSREVYLAMFLRAKSADLTTALCASRTRYLESRAVIRQALESGKQYPWTQLLRLRPDKIFSDLVESVLGAIFIDSGGNLDRCKAFIEKLGLLSYMDRLIDEDLDVSHPQEHLLRLAGAKHVSYTVERDEATGHYRCALLVDNVKLDEVDGCYDKEEAIALVSKQGMEEILRERVSKA